MVAAEKSSVSQRRAAIVAAATTLFSRYGFRKTSVDLIAREARVAKPTVYAHFEDKEAVFVAVCRDVTDCILEGARAAAAEADVVLRVTGVLAAKFTRLFELIDSSPHGRELLESADAQAKAVVEASDQKYLELLGATLRAAEAAGELDLTTTGQRAGELAKTLLMLGHGAAYGAASAAAHKKNLEGLVRLLLRPLVRATPPKRAAGRRRP